MTTDVPTTPNEGDPQDQTDLGQHYADVQSQPLVLSPQDEERIAQAIEEGEQEVAEADELHSLDDPTGLKAAVAKMPTGEDLKARPAFILSEVDTNHPSGRSLVLGWDTCGECHLHIRVCLCPAGPHRPSYIDTWHKENEEANQRLADLRAERARKATVVADPVEVETQVAEVLEERTPTGRKKRSDAGVPRGPRKKGTADSVSQAADDLATAMTPKDPA